MLNSIKILIFLLLSISSLIKGQSEDPLIVDIPDLGQIQGIYASTTDEPRYYVSFHGIPFADPASYTGPNRFQPPKIWEGPLPSLPFLAINPLVMCPQDRILGLFEPDEGETRSWDFRRLLNHTSFSGFPNTKIPEEFFQSKSSDPKEEGGPYLGQEDCLVMNVNTPKVPKEGDGTELLPILFYIHGSRSDYLWSGIFNGGRFLNHDVVMVSMNYRLGALGAFNLDIDSVPGNQAMYDVVLAMEWVQKYIHHFGGDPRRVTLVGFSAGAMMTTHMLLSPLVKDKDYFHGAIASSGSVLNIWGTAKEPSLPYHLRVAEFAECYTAGDEVNPEQIGECMRGLTINKLLWAQNQFTREMESTGNGVGLEANIPSVQSPFLTIPRFIEENPINVLKEKRQSPVPLMMGTARHDGTYVMPTFYKKFLVHNDLINNTEFMRHDLVPTFLKAMGIDINPTFADSVARTYLGDAKLSPDFESKIPGIIDICSLFFFKAGTLKMVEYQSEVQPNTFYYNFDFKSVWPVQDLVGDTEVIPGGIGHGDEWLYLFQLLPLFFNPVDLEVSRRLVQYYINFIYYGNPNGLGDEVWPRWDPDTLPYLSVNAEDEVLYSPRDNWVGMGEDLIWKGVD